MFDVLHMHLYLKSFFASFFITLIATPLVRSAASRLGVLDYPGEISMHTRPIPRMGGVAIFLGFVLSVVTVAGYDAAEGILIGGTIVLFIGLLDDLYGVPAVIKLLLIIAVTYLLSRYGIILNIFKSYHLNLAFTILWIATVVSAFNAVDNMNGLACGLAFISAMGYFLVAIQTTQWQWGLLAVALMGSSLAFLRYNLSDASIFLGDSGAFFLGFVLAAMGVMGEWSTHPVKASIVPILILGVVNADLAYTIIQRYRRGVTGSVSEIIAFRGKDHLSHRLVDLGLSPREAVFFLYLLSLCAVMGAVVLRNARPVDAILLLIQFIFVFLIVTSLMSLGNKKQTG